MPDQEKEIEWVDTQSLDCLDLMKAVIQEELDARAAAGDFTPADFDSTVLLSELIADALLNPFVIRRRTADQPLMR